MKKNDGRRRIENTKTSVPDQSSAIRHDGRHDASRDLMAHRSSACKWLERGLDWSSAVWANGIIGSKVSAHPLVE